MMPNKDISWIFDVVQFDDLFSLYYTSMTPVMDNMLYQNLLNGKYCAFAFYFFRYNWHKTSIKCCNIYIQPILYALYKFLAYFPTWRLCFGLLSVFGEDVREACPLLGGRTAADLLDPVTSKRMVEWYSSVCLFQHFISTKIKLFSDDFEITAA